MRGQLNKVEKDVDIKVSEGVLADKKKLLR